MSASEPERRLPVGRFIKSMSSLSSRVSILLFVVLFVVSTMILIVASTADIPAPAWGGYLDVGIVLLIAILGFTIHQRNKGTPRYDISHQAAIYLVPLILVVMWLYREKLDFNILLPGAAWRTYFFLSILPHAASLWKQEQP